MGQVKRIPMSVELEHRKRLAEVASERRRIQSKYDKAIREATEAGLSNSAIGRAVGLTETAIRNWRKRRMVR